MKKNIILICLFEFFLFFILISFIHRQSSYQEYIYQKYIYFIKSSKFLEAHKILYPLAIQEKNRKAMKMVSMSYIGGDGVDMDMVKAQIWIEKSEVCPSCETGTNEFEQYQVFLNKKDYGMASVFLQRAAEKGNKEAILILKDRNFLEKNHLHFDPNWEKYWHDFDYDTLYPFIKEIEK